MFTQLGQNSLQAQQAQQAQAAQSQAISVTQVCQNTNVLLKSLVGPEVCNDERDRVIALLNQLLVGVGTGQGYYANNQQPVAYNSKNLFCRFKGVSYNRVSHNSDADGICALILNVPSAQIADTTQQNNLAAKVDEILGQKQSVNTIVDSVKALDAQRTEVTIHVFEKGVGKVRATHLFKFLSQPDKQKLLEQQLRCVKIVPLVELSKEDRERHLNTAPEGFDLKHWLQGVRLNPLPEHFLPAPVYGFDQLIERQKMQKVSTSVQQTLVDDCQAKCDELDKTVGWYSSKLKVCHNTHKELSHRLLRIACALCKETRQGYGLSSKEDELSAVAEQCHTMLFSPNALKDRLNAIVSLLETDKDRIREYFHKVDLNLRSDDIATIKFNLSTVQKKLETVKQIQENEKRDLAVIKSKRL